MVALFLIILLSLISGVIVGIKTTWYRGLATCPAAFVCLTWIWFNLHSLFDKEE